MKGFTLFEVVIVMTIVIVISAVGIVNLSRLQNVFRLKSSADQIKAQIQLGRELAIANKNGAIYNINLSSNIFKLQADGKEMDRYQIPAGIVMTPTSINWNFTSVSGELSSCSSCQITLTLGNQTEIINIHANGIVN